MHTNNAGRRVLEIPSTSERVSLVLSYSVIHLHGMGFGKSKNMGNGSAGFGEMAKTQHISTFIPTHNPLRSECKSRSCVSRLE